MDVEGGFDSELATLRETRMGRARPATDHKGLAAWNGLMIGALAQAGRTAEAERAAENWVSWIDDSGLPHMVTDGRPSGRPFLDDLAFLADGLLDLAEATGEGRWHDAARRLADQMVSDHLDQAGGLFFSPNDGEPLFGRSKPFMDNATPSPNGVAARVFRRLGREAEARAVLAAAMGWIERAPTATSTLTREALQMLLAQGGAALATAKPDARPTAAVAVTLEPQDVPLEDDGYGYAEIVLDIRDGHHVNSNEPAANWLVATDVEVEGAYAEAAYPENKDGVYVGRTVIGLRLRPNGDRREFGVRVRFQACTETECALPEVRALEGRLK